MNTRSLTMTYETFGLNGLPTTYSSIYIFFFLLEHVLYTPPCASQGFSVVEFHHIGCFPLHCPLDLKMDCPFISLCTRALGVRSVPAFAPSFISGASAKPPPSPARCQLSSPSRVLHKGEAPVSSVAS